MRKQDWTTRTMTFDELVHEVNTGCGWSFLEICRKDGRWNAYWQNVDIRGTMAETQEQPLFAFDTAAGALEMLIRWFRGKTVRHHAPLSGTPGQWVEVPADLEPPAL